MKLEHFLTPYTKIKLKSIKDLNVKPETIKLLDENIGKALFDINHSKIFFKVMKNKKKNKKMGLIKLKSFSSAKETINKMKSNPQNRRKHLQMKQVTKD